MSVGIQIVLCVRMSVVIHIVLCVRMSIVIHIVLCVRMSLVIHIVRADEHAHTMRIDVIHVDHSRCVRSSLIRRLLKNIGLFCKRAL